MRWGLWCGTVALCLSAQEVPPDILLLAKIKVKMEENLTRLPNYTCTQTIERSHRRPPGRKFELLDVLRLEVALVNGNELFAWPGSSNFSDKPLDEMVNEGAIATGNFGLHARAIFLSNAAEITREPDIVEGGRTMTHFRYNVKLLRSGFHMKTPYGESVVPYHGEFWADAKTLDLTRLQVVADDIPLQLRVLRSEDIMEYQRLQIGEGEFLLPQSSDLRMLQPAGGESRNRTRFSRCRQFSGESKLIFDDEPTAAPAVTKVEAPRDVKLPPNVWMEMALDQDLLDHDLAVGDPVTAVLVRPVKLHKEILVPKGALALGRVTHFSFHDGQTPYFTIGLEFHAIRFENGRADFHAEFLDMQGMVNMTPKTASLRTGGTPSVWLGAEPTLRESAKSNDAVFYVKGRSLHVPKGLRLSWRTTAEEPK